MEEKPEGTVKDFEYIVEPENPLRDYGISNELFMTLLDKHVIDFHGCRDLRIAALFENYKILDGKHGKAQRAITKLQKENYPYLTEESIHFIIYRLPYEKNKHTFNEVMGILPQRNLFDG